MGMTWKACLAVTLSITTACGLARSQQPTTKSADSPAPKKVWLSHSGTNPFVPLAKDKASFARMVKVFQANDSQSASTMFNAKQMIPVELGTEVRLLSTEGTASLVEIPTGLYTGTRWYVHSSFISTQAQAQAIRAKSRPRSKHAAGMAQLDAAMNQMYAQWQTQIAMEQAAYQAAAMEKAAREKATQDAIMRSNQQNAAMHYCIYGRGTANQCRNIVTTMVPYCFLHRQTIGP